MGRNVCIQLKIPKLQLIVKFKIIKELHGAS